MFKQERRYLNEHAVSPKKRHIIKMLHTCVVDLKPFHLDRTGNCRTERDVNGVYRPKGLDKEKIYDPIQNVGKFSMSLVNYKKKQLQPIIQARNQQ